jgi:hypothetical protein
MRNDILLDTDGDLLWGNGDFVVGESSYQEMAAIINANPGEYRHSPVTGFRRSKYLKKTETPQERIRFVSELKVKLELDGFKNFKIDVSNGIRDFQIYI